MNWMFSNVNLNSPVKRQKALYFSPTGCSPPIFVALLLIHVLADTEKHWSVAFWVMYYYHNVLFVFTSTYLEKEKPICSFPGGTCYSTLFLLQASKQPALARISMMVISFHSAKIFAEVKVTEEAALQAASFIRNQGGNRVRSWGRFTLKQPFALSWDSQRSGFPLRALLPPLSQGCY